MTLRNRLARAEAARRPAGRFSLLLLVPAADAGGRPPGLYPLGGSTAAWVYAGNPDPLPWDQLAPWCKVLDGPDPWAEEASASDAGLPGA